MPTLLYTPLGLWILARDKTATATTAAATIATSTGAAATGRNSAAVVESSARAGSGRRLRFEMLEPSSTSAGLAASTSNDVENDDDDDGDEPLLQTTHRRQGSTADLANGDHQNSMPRSLWYRLSKHLLHPYRGVIILLLTCQLLLPVAEHAGQLKSSISFDLLLPSRSPSLQTYHVLGTKKGLGALNPYRILFDGNVCHHLSTDGCAIIGSTLTRRLIKAMGK